MANNKTKKQFTSKKILKFNNKNSNNSNSKCNMIKYLFNSNNNKKQQQKINK